MKKLLTGPIKFYRKHISPNTPPSCRYHPTCSSYALQAIEKHGALKGGVMSTARILRCNPFIDGGVDEVPDHFTLFRNPDNINDVYIPDYLQPLDKEAQETLDQLLEKYENELIISEHLPASATILEQIADVRALTPGEIKDHFSEDELDYLIEIEIFPEFDSENYKYYTIVETEKNEAYFQEVHPYFEETDIGEDYPLIVLEKTGIWYTNLPELGRQFMIQRGVTENDLKDRSYHLWLVLHAIEEANNV